MGNSTKPELLKLPLAKKQSMLGTQSQWAGLEIYHPALQTLRQVIDTWYNNFWGMDSGGAVIIGGGCGCGKTHIATKIYNAYLEAGAELITEPDLFARLWGAQRTREDFNVINQLRKATPLIVDDVGTLHIRPETQTYIHEKYWLLLNNRSQPLLMTSNLEKKEFAAWIGERANSRLLEQIKQYSGGYVDLFDVPDYRKKGLQQKVA